MFMLQTSFLSSEGGKKINRLSIVSCYCKLLSGNTVNWPLLNPRSALFSWARHLIVFAFVLSLTLALSLQRVFPVPPCWPHTANSHFVMKHFSPWASLRTLQGIALTSVCQRSYLSSCKHRQDLCVCSCVWFENLVLRAQKHRLEKTGTGSETASRANTRPRLQVETIPDESPICFHFRVWVLN